MSLGVDLLMVSE